jgi:hypothetical protein
MMALYVASHYKNSPNDLQLMADAPAHHLFVLLGMLVFSWTTFPFLVAMGWTWFYLLNAQVLLTSQKISFLIFCVSFRFACLPLWWMSFFFFGSQMNWSECPYLLCNSAAKAILFSSYGCLLFSWFRWQLPPSYGILCFYYRRIILLSLFPSNCHILRLVCFFNNIILVPWPNACTLTS